MARKQRHTPEQVIGKLREALAHLLDEGLIDGERQEVGIGEVAIVVRFLLAAHGARLALVGVVEPRLLQHLATGLDELDLTRHLVLDGLLDVAEGVDVLDLRAGPELVGPFGRTDTLASQRNDPSCMLPSQISRYRTSVCTFFM